MRSNRHLIALTLLGAAALFALTGCGSTTSGSGSAPDTVTAVGSGTGSATPDTAQVSMGVTVNAKTSTEAQGAASTKSAAIIAAVKAAGIADADIQTGQISLNPQYGNTGSTVTGYQAFQSIDIKTKSVDKVSAAVTAATNAGATNVSGPTFTLTDTGSAGTDAISKAMADAKARADAMAKAAGRTLGRVISVTEGTAGAVVPVYDTALAGSAKSSVPVPVQPGQVDTQVQLTVVFALQ
jgi:uncharacterized protein YggE